MKIGTQVLVILAWLAPSFAAADDSCSDFKSALETLDVTRSVRKSVEAMVNSTEDALSVIPKAERDKVMENLKNDVKTAYYTAYLDYRDANISAHNAARHAADSAAVSNDSSIQTAILMSGATVRIIGAVLPKESEKSEKRERKRVDSLDTLDSVVDGFFMIIASTACK